MVRIIDYKSYQKENGDSFYALIVQGGVEVIISKETGRTYLTARKASVPCTFDEQTCISLIGTELSGQIVQVEVEPYSFTVEETGEVIERNHRYMFMNDEQAVLQQNVQKESVF